MSPPTSSAAGKPQYRAHYGRLSRVEQRTGVPASVILAIYGNETSYGAVTGNFDVLDALATLAYEGRRRDLFEGEFVAALKLLDLGIPRWRLKGSWAGATGYPQFMPSVALRLRADGDGDGVADIWRSELDGLRLDRQLSARRRLEAEHAVGRARAVPSTASTAPRSAIAVDRAATARASMPATAGR